MSELENENQQQLALEQARLERLKAEESVLDKQREAEQAKERLRAQHEESLLAEAIRSGPKFHPDRKMLIKLLREPEHGLEFNGDEVTALAGNRRVPIGEFLEFLAESKPYLADGRSLRSIQQRKAEQEKPVKARSEMSRAEKIELLSKPGGLEEWERRPAYPTKMVPLSELTLQQFSKLPVSEKTRLVSQNPNLVEELARRGRR